MRQNLKTRSGNRIAIVLDGKQIGLLQSVRANDDYSPEPASGIGDIHVVEHVPTMARHSLSVSAMLLNRGAMLEAGVATENGETALLGLVCDIEVYSKDDGALLRKYIGCTYASGDLEVSKHAIVMQSGQFMALDVTGSAA
ncbi:hypothetical protein FHR70_000752 [Microvirga lupini]|uniref:Uncharacterized protein n=1 Tax=Microvirga lupini TaxID=420324 RepID=A0A7W4VIF8_9HYPH|nr:hypothetical protein [Microvirga lupini]MBB3017712.1 hypothetical protein [Microvirga lupini]